MNDHMYSVKVPSSFENTEKLLKALFFGRIVGVVKSSALVDHDFFYHIIQNSPYQVTVLMTLITILKVTTVIPIADNQIQVKFPILAVTFLLGGSLQLHRSFQKKHNKFC